MMRVFVAASCVALFSSAGICQTISNKPAFEIADLHASPRSQWVKTAANSMQGGLLIAGRYELRRATMLDLLKIAYGIDPDKVVGPNWLDYDRFDVIAKVPAGTRPQELPGMLQALLADRFNLAIKMDSKPLPAYVLSAAQDKLKLKPAAESGFSGCQNQFPPPIIGGQPYISLQCRNVTMEAFASALRGRLGGGQASLPAVDKTGIEGAWDFDLQYPAQAVRLNGNAEPATGGSAALIEAAEKQLGLKLELQKVPQPVLVIESLNEQPSANPPGVSASLPPLPPPAFEVASVRPCDGKGPNTAPRFESAGRVTAHCMYLMSLISQAFHLAPFETPAGAPKWLTDGGGPSLTILAKAPAGFEQARGIGQNQDVLNAMIRALLVDRFKMAFHYEDRPMDAYTLTAVKPKLAKAGPSNRTGCARQTPGAGGRSISLQCLNMTIAQFAEQIQAYDPDIYYPVLDGTRLDGAWDFTLNYDVVLPNLAVLMAQARARAGVPAPDPSAQAEAPSGAVSFVDAIEKQLGLKLEKQRRTEPVLVIDHIEEQPSEN